MKDSYRPRSAREAQAARGGRVRRTGVFHKAAFGELLAAALQGQSCLRHGGAYWEPVVAGKTFGIYRRAPDMLACVQEQVEDYESLVYGPLLRGAFGRDDVLRPRTRLWRGSNGTLRPFSALSGGADDE